MSDSEPDIDPPRVASWLESFLSVRRKEYEEQFGDVEPEGLELDQALYALERHAAELILTGVLPVGLAEKLEAFQPGDGTRDKLLELLQYQIVHHRLEFDVAEQCVGRLTGLDERVTTVAMLTMVLLGYTPSDTAVKYFRRATTLYLAGFETESVVMCGAVLEAALRARFPDEVLSAEGIKPAYRKAGDYSVSQRLKFEADHPVFDEGLRQRATDLVHWRNDSVHVQPDVTPSARNALINLALLLPALFPGDA